jgi:energy-coupling factor transporter ATP-binding protein EcfA2
MTMVLSVASLSFTYPALSSHPAPASLRDISFTLNAGEWVVLLGATGSGKTTLCGILANLIPHMTGGVLSGTMRKTDGLSIGLVFQEAEAQLFTMTVEDEIAFGLETSGLTREQMQARVRQWLAWARLTEYVTHAPRQLSGGQKKRLALASVLAMSPALLVLDEPTAGLDPLGAQDVLEALNDLRRQGEHTVFIATSDVELAVHYADRVLVMEAGRITLAGAPREVFKQTTQLNAVGALQIVALAQALNAHGNAYDFVTLDEAERDLQQTAAEKKKEEKGKAPAAVLPLSSCCAFEDVWFQYPDSTFALRGVTLSIAQGSFVALVGANGSGKTTLAKHANGLLRPTRGVVRLAGRNIQHDSTAQLARRVGYVFQNPDHQLFAATVREELAFGLRNIGLEECALKQRIDEALEVFDLYEVATQPPVTLGYGARRLVTLAATWAMRPALWILDEPTTGLDARHADWVWQCAREAQRTGATIVSISHDIARVAVYAERVVVLERGQIIADGAPHDIFSDVALLQRARLSAPPVTTLAQRLGWASTPLTVAEFVETLMP